MSGPFLACALCDPAEPRPASIACTNRCGRFVCTEHAQARPDGRLVCDVCWEKEQAVTPRSVTGRLLDQISSEQPDHRPYPAGTPSARPLILLLIGLLMLGTLLLFFIMLTTLH